MAGWQNFYLQKMGVDGNNEPYSCCESVGTWGVFCKDIPFKLWEKVKEPAKRTWNDEHGDDEYIPSTGLFMESYTMSVEFGCKLIGSDKSSTYGISVDDVREKVAAFLEYLRSSGMLMLYSSHTRIGRQNVRLDSIKDDAKWVSETETVTVGNSEQVVGVEFLVFDVTFKVNDPVTDIVYDDGELKTNTDTNTDTDTDTDE